MKKTTIILTDMKIASMISDMTYLLEGLCVIL
jgi:hypothetical protein